MSKKGKHVFNGKEYPCCASLTMGVIGGKWKTVILYHLKDEAKALGERLGQPKWFSILEAVTKVMEPYERRGLYPNVDFWAGAVYYLLEIPEDLFIPLFAMGRIPGWTIQILEQYENNILLRPLLHYNGEESRPYINIDSR